MQNSEGYASPSAVEFVPFKRPGFTTFWLYFMLVVNIVVAGLNIFLGDFISFGLNLVTIAGVAALLYWKKWGFWVIMVVQVIGFLIVLPQVIDGSGQLRALMSPVIGLLILWGVLHSQRNGQTTWDHLK
ncbi:MAG TPA: hypothetical protein VIO36_10595 [Anaerolineaceae bacterium]